MTIKKLTKEDARRLSALIRTVEENLTRKEFWLPVNETSAAHFFDPDWTEFWGVFEEDRLIAASALFFNPHEYGESISHLPDREGPVAEVGRCMVHPDFRGRNLLYQLNGELIRSAAARGIRFLLATIHPENTPSQKSFQKSGFEKSFTYTKNENYLRDIYTMEL